MASPIPPRSAPRPPGSLQGVPPPEGQGRVPLFDVLLVFYGPLSLSNMFPSRMPFISSHLPFTHGTPTLLSMHRHSRHSLHVIRRTALDQNQNEEIEVPPMSAWKKYARIILPHVGLCLLSLLYVSGGAVAFYHLERPHEMAVRESSIRRFNAHKDAMLDELWDMLESGHSSEAIELVAGEYIENVTRILFDAFDTHYISSSHLRPGGEDEAYSWTLITALFFTATLLTTIGYGNLVPVTWQGRMFCIAYALLGVPLILITVADIGKFLSENIIWLYTRYSKARKRYLNQYTAVPTSEDNQDDGLMQVAGLEPYVSIPVIWIIAILLGYIAIGAVLLGSWENWAFFSGFYFSFITMTTVGFGDIVPTNREFYLLDLCYIIIGLAITTMCIDLVGIQYIRKIHYFGRAIKDARFALVNVGGKMVHVPDLMRYASVLQQKYGHKKPHESVFVKGAYAPKDLHKIRFIDYGALASLESFQSIWSTIFSTKSKEQPL